MYEILYCFNHKFYSNSSKIKTDIFDKIIIRVKNRIFLRTIECSKLLSDNVNIYEEIHAYIKIPSV